MKNLILKWLGLDRIRDRHEAYDRRIDRAINSSNELSKRLDLYLLVATRPQTNPHPVYDPKRDERGRFTK